MSNSCFFAFIVIIVLIDQFTKFFINNFFLLGQSFPLIKNIIHITLVYNSGSAFGLFKGANFFFILIAILASLIIIYIVLIGKYPFSTGIKLCLLLILSGAVGNLIDRLIYGYVIDFIDLRIWPVFNIADAAISIGMVLLIINLSKNKANEV